MTRRDFTRAPTATAERRAAMEDALSWALPQEALDHIDLHVVSGDLINLLEERDFHLIGRSSDPEPAPTKITAPPPASWAEGAADLLDRALYLRSMSSDDAVLVEAAITDHLKSRRRPTR